MVKISIGQLPTFTAEQMRRKGKSLVSHGIAAHAENRCILLASVFSGIVCHLRLMPALQHVAKPPRHAHPPCRPPHRAESSLQAAP